jgi:hypothetical protein
MPWWLKRWWRRAHQGSREAKCEECAEVMCHFKFDFDFLYTIGRPSATAGHISFGAQAPLAMNFQNAL